ncbi:tripartite tricarboxylate transporter TctB family protein [Salinifilum aidingensis]
MSTAPSPAATTPVTRRAKPRGELVVALLVAAIAATLLVRTASMDVPGTSGYLGPQFFPAVVGVLLLVLSALLVLQHLRAPAPPTEQEHADESAPSEAAGAPGMDWKPFGIVVATLVLHVLLLEPLGWLIAGAGLFAGVSYALGGRHVLRDIGIAFVLSSAAQLGFSAGLGITLPAGVLGGVM